MAVPDRRKEYENEVAALEKSNKDLTELVIHMCRYGIGKRLRSISLLFRISLGPNFLQFLKVRVRLLFLRLRLRSFR